MSGRRKSPLPLLGRALKRLDEALSRPKDPFIRDSAIQRFEFTYELVWKTLKAYLERQGLEARSPRDCLKGAFQIGLIADDPMWLKTIELRNLTTHTYHEPIAERVYKDLPKVLALYEKLARDLKKAGF